jgi:3-methyladenine DNA glycosylase Tag
MPREDWEAYTQDKRVVRNWIKIKAVMENTGFIFHTANEHGCFAKFIADWPSSDQIGLLEYLKKNGSRLGGKTGQWFLRYIGKDCFVTTKDVVHVIQQAGFDINDNPTSKRDLKVVQQVFNDWHQETALPYTHLSKIAAYSIGQNYQNDEIIIQTKKFSAKE